MPHFHIDYSGGLEGGLEGVVDMGDFCGCLRDAAESLGVFPVAGIRVRALRVDHYVVADGDEKHGFIDISVRIGEGRSDEVKKDIVDRVFLSAEDFLRPVLEVRSLALSVELREIDSRFSRKGGTIREHMRE